MILFLYQVYFSWTFIKKSKILSLLVEQLILVQAQQFGTGTRYVLGILHQCGKKVKTKSQKVLGANSYVCRSYTGKTGRGPFWRPILNRVTMYDANRDQLDS